MMADILDHQGTYGLASRPGKLMASYVQYFHFASYLSLQIWEVSSWDHVLALDFVVEG
jgi:hypothetical protein